MSELSLRTGDIGLVRAPRGFLGWLLHLAGRLGLLKPQQYEHAFIIYGIAGDFYVVEAAIPRVRDAVPLGDRWQYCDFYRPVGSTALQSAAAAFFALRQVGAWYGLGTLIPLAVQQMRRWLYGRLVSVAEAYICTELVVSAWREAGMDILPGVPADRVMPDMIAESELASRR